MRIDEYLARARAITGSDRATARALGVSHNSTNAWNTARAWPSDDAMLALANLIGMDAKAALLDLNTWRAKSAEVRAQYLQLRQALALTVFAALVTGGATGTTAEQFSRAVPLTIPYAIFGARRRRQKIRPRSSATRTVSYSSLSAFALNFPRAATAA